ncbi:ATP-grasp domain-containing protein [Streptomyces sp. NBC_01619]|nr:ATP-grasp domain-containing protein [Streptomyces sp. NBC_01619]
MRASGALATAVTTYAIPLLVLTTTGSTALTGVAFLLGWLPRLAAFTVGGPLVDRYRADRVFRMTTVCRSLLLAATALALGLMPSTGPTATIVVMAAGALCALLAQASFIAVETMGAEASRRDSDQPHRVQSLQTGIDQGALLVGPLLGGLLLLAGPSCLLAAVALLSLIAALATPPMSAPAAGPTRSEDQQPVIASLRTGLRNVCGIPALGWLITGLIASNLALAVVQASAPITVLHDYGESSLAMGIVWSAAGMLSLAAVAASRRLIDRHGLWPVGAAAAAIGCVACFATALAPGLNSYAVAIGVLMAGEGALTVVLRTLRSRLIPADDFGSTLSVSIVLIVIPMPVAGALVAALPSTALPALLLVCSTLQGIAMALAFRGLRRHRASYALSRSRTSAHHLLKSESCPVSNPMLLVIGSEPELMRRYMLESAAADNPLVLIDDQAPTWQRPYITDYETADLKDPAAVIAAGESLARRWTIAGVLTFNEYHVFATARLAARLHLPGNTPRTAAAARDKTASRQRFAASHVPSAAFARVHSLDAAAAAAERLGGYPVVLKPTGHAGSIGVVRVDNAADLPSSWAIASAGAALRGSEDQSVLVEEFLDGPEISVETVTQNGVTTAVAVTHKSVGFAPYFMEKSHLVIGGDLLLPQVAPIAEAALRAIGVSHGVSHVEMKLTDSGPRLIEVNARLGGDRIGELVRYATGVDLAKAAAALACGRTPSLKPASARSAAIGMIYPPTDGSITARGLRAGDDEHLHDLQWLCEVGDQVTLTPSSQTPNNIRAGFAIVTGNTGAEACRHLDDALERAVVEVRPAMVST